MKEDQRIREWWSTPAGERERARRRAVARDWWASPAGETERARRRAVRAESERERHRYPNGRSRADRRMAVMERTRRYWLRKGSGGVGGPAGGSSARVGDPGRKASHSDRPGECD